ncbi:ATP-dependent DNA helicase PIF1-like [Littorina saxatilis]|uniref:ATP-dependent DNA helicase PIF1-like n=1 Tax=Littorina saxatilis TaxID=31220 RepID=UPI0038B4EBF9
MVSDKMFTYISRRLSSIKQTPLPFGGLNIITIGDFFQLRPVKGKTAGGLMSTLMISVSTRVMLIRNICTSDGLVNGAMGLGVSLSSIQNGIPIKPIEHTFMFLGHQIVRSQFPLMPSWACTVHKVQGLSLDKAALDLGSTVFEKGMSYVALSRLRSLQGLTIIRLDPYKFECSDEVLEEYSRLRDTLSPHDDV